MSRFILTGLAVTLLTSSSLFAQQCRIGPQGQRYCPPADESQYQVVKFPSEYRRVGYRPEIYDFPAVGFAAEVTSQGLLITRVFRCSEAWRIGLERGDLVVRANGCLIRSSLDWQTVLNGDASEVSLIIAPWNTRGMYHTTAQLANNELDCPLNTTPAELNAAKIRGVETQAFPAQTFSQKQLSKPRIMVNPDPDNEPKVPETNGPAGPIITPAPGIDPMNGQYFLAPPETREDFTPPNKTEPNETSSDIINEGPPSSVRTPSVNPFDSPSNFDFNRGASQPPVLRGPDVNFLPDAETETSNSDWKNSGM